MIPINYYGPGRYLHYKGGIYHVLGLGEHETTKAKFVVYTSASEPHTAARLERGVYFILRPLNPEDGPDCWNSFVDVPSGKFPRFQQILE